ncbi:MAG TPA: GvpL/GvpF family gas vesicle protein [Actinomycetales bacterium]|nr:GvpL/GvpF family gas vesicle protein [Actinomycetales bacterium]
MIVLFAVVPRGRTEVSGLKTLAGEHVNVLYDVQDVPPGRSVKDVLDFGAKLQSVAQTGPVLPVRYGSVLADIADLRDLVRTREASWAQQLDRVAGHRELIVHLRLTEGASPSPADTGSESGTEYLRRRAARLHAREAVLAGLLQTVGPRLKDHRSLAATDEERVALLVPETDVDHVRRAIDEWGDSAADLAVKVSGPWPPFSFCEDPGA